MNKNAIQKFAVWARKEMIAQVSQRAYQYGIIAESCGEENAVTVNGRALSTDEQRQRAELVQQIEIKGYDQVMEEVAYTWFNRFIALRYMEVNNYLPSHIRVFSDANGAFKPEILADVLHLELDGLDKQKVAAYIEQNQTDDLYRYLLLTQCNALNVALPGMFERLGSYTELLLPNNILKADGILGRLVSDIPEEDWHDQVQIIGWLYQYYITELNEKVYDGKMSKSKVQKELLPAATTIYTPDWAARYMVENSLGRLIASTQCAADSEEARIEKEKIYAEKMGWKYFLPEAAQKPNVRAQLEKINNHQSPETLKIIDPCMGSGHILVYAFDMLIQIYEDNGINQRDAAQRILQHNLYGLDIDDRAAQLAYFAVMMKARQYDRRIFSRGIQPHLYAIHESADISEEICNYFESDETLAKRLWETFRDAKEFGSIVVFDFSQKEIDQLSHRLEQLKQIATTGDIAGRAYANQALKKFKPLLQVAEVLVQKYDVVVTNPPYFGSSRFSPVLDKYVKKHYKEVKSDLSMTMYQKALRNFVKPNGFVAFITTTSWMFLSSFEKLRQFLNEHYSIYSIVDFGTELFDGKVGHNPIVAWVTRNLKVDYKMTAVRLVEFCYSRRDEKEPEFFNEENRYTAQQSNFSKIPGSPVAYWVSDCYLKLFDYNALSTSVIYKEGITTGDNEKFLRLWYEIDKKRISFEKNTNKCFWVPYNKGGSYRKWFGNREYIIDWENKGEKIKIFKGSTFRNEKFQRREGGTFSSLTSGNISVRYSESGFCFDSKGTMFFTNDLLNVIGYMNCNVFQQILGFVSPTLDYRFGTIQRLPKLEGDKSVTHIVKDNIKLSKKDWDSFETSWDFQQDPIVRYSRDLRDAAAIGAKMNVSHDGTKQSFHSPIELAYLFWKGECNQRFRELKKNEEELNRIFIDIYGLQDELTPEVADKDVTVYCVYDTKEDFPESLSGSNYVLTKRDVIVNFISYAVGCMFGRYSLYNDGILYAGGGFGDFGSLVEKIQDHLHAQGKSYFTEKDFYPDSDNIIPICDDEYFDDDVTGRFVKFVETVFGEDSLEDNLQFIANALGGKGMSREIIRNYFLKEFYTDHCKKYKKRPIYWLFDSGKKNGFKALIYMHRYQPDLLARMRTDYVHEQQERYRTQLAHIDEAIQQASGSERVKLTKQQKKLQDQSLEIQKYEEKIHHLADQNIVIDLDDGVKHNYALFADVLAKIK